MKSLKQLIVKLMNRVCIIMFVFLLGNSMASAHSIIWGYWEAGTIEGVFFNGYGTPTTPDNNPDKFCEAKGNGYVLPRAGQYNIAYLGKPPITGNNDTMNGADFRTRKVGSLISEWGAGVSLYSGSAWDQFFSSPTLYWVAEPHGPTSRHMINLSSPIDIPGFVPRPPGGFLEYGAPLYYGLVACVRPLL